MKELDFLPASYHQARRRRRRFRATVGYCLALTVVLVGSYLIHHSRIRTAEAALATLESRGEEHLARRAHLQDLEQQKRRLSQRLALLGRLDDDAPLDVVLAGISRLMGETMAIRSVVLEREPTAAGQPGARGATLEGGPTHVTLVGVAPNDVEVGVLLGRLTECPIFREVGLDHSRDLEQAGRQMREFQVELDVRCIAVDPQ